MSSIYVFFFFRKVTQDIPSLPYVVSCIILQTCQKMASISLEIVKLNLSIYWSLVLLVKNDKPM